MAWQTPSSAVTAGIRPLDKGIILDQPSQVIPDGAFVNLRNFIANKEGPKRTPGFDQFAGGFVCPYKPLDFVTLWATDGGQESLLITDRTLWRVNPISMSEVEWVTYSAGTVSVSGLVVTGSGTSWDTEDVLPGDLLRIGATEGVIKTIASATSIELETSNIPDQVGSAYKIVATFTPGLVDIPDWTVFANNLIIADGKRALLAYDSGTNALGYWVDNPAKYPSTGEFIACCVTSFLDRVWCGYTSDASDGVQRQRIRWSALADPRDFSIPTNYMDLPYVNGALTRLLPLGSRLMAYFDDSVFRGTQTNYPLMPVRFDLMDTGGIGLVGRKAITGYLNGHFWVGQDDMYLTAEDGLQRIGSPVVKASIKTCSFPHLVYVATDPWNFNVVFGFPIDNEWLEKTWRYDYRSRSWSYDDIPATMLANPVVNATLDWNDLTGTWDTLAGYFPTWDSMDLTDPRKLLYRAWENKLWKQSCCGALNDETDPIEAELITKDHDFDSPDSLKTWVRFAIKVEADPFPTIPIVFAAYVSTNRGRTWKAVGNLIVRDGFDEGYVNFRATGSTCRFKLVSSSEVESYSIGEYTMKVRMHGSERDVSTQV